MIDPEYRSLFVDTLILLEAVPDDAHCSIRLRDAKERIRQRMAPLPDGLVVCTPPQATPARPEAESVPAQCPQCHSDGEARRIPGVVGDFICGHHWHDQEAPSEPAGNTGQACDHCGRVEALTPYNLCHICG